MKNARINSLSFGIALALAGTQVPSNAVADITLPEPPPVFFDSSSFSAYTETGSAVMPIQYGSPTNGAIGDANDYIGSDGVKHTDYFTFEVTDPSLGHVVTLRSDSFAGLSTLWFVDQSTNSWIPEQSAYVWEPGKQTQYSGSVSQPGIWVIEVTSIDENQGSYTISLDGRASDATTPTNCEAPTSDNPFVEVSPGSTQNCSLSGDEQIVLNTDRGTHYAKGFTFTGNGGAATIRAESGAFTPWIVLIDPASDEVLDVKEGVLSGQFTGDVYYLVTSAEPGATGAFSTGVEAGGPSSGGYLQPAEMRPSLELSSHYEIVE